jgi:hypothetical protein
LVRCAISVIMAGLPDDAVYSLRNYLAGRVMATNPQRGATASFSSPTSTCRLPPAHLPQHCTAHPHILLRAPRRSFLGSNILMPRDQGAAAHPTSARSPTSQAHTHTDGDACVDPGIHPSRHRHRPSVIQPSRLAITLRLSQVWLSIARVANAHGVPS